MSGALLLALAAVADPSPTLFIGASAHRPALVAFLRIERPGLAVVTTATAADVRVELRAQRLVVARRPGVVVVERDLDLSGAPQAAVRVAGLLILRAVDLPAARVRPFAVAGPATPAPNPPRARPPPARPRVGPVQPSAHWVFLGPSAAYWPSGQTADVGVLGGYVQVVGRYRWGAAAAVGGLCCTATTEGVRGRRLTVGGWVFGGRTLWQGPAVQWRIDAGVGAQYGRITAQARVFEGTAVEERVNTVAALVRASTAVRWQWDPRWALDVGAGAHAIFPRRRVALPPAFVAEPLAEPAVAPWLAITIERGF